MKNFNRLELLKKLHNITRDSLYYTEFLDGSIGIRDLNNKFTDLYFQNEEELYTFMFDWALDSLDEIALYIYESTDANLKSKARKLLSLDSN